MTDNFDWVTARSECSLEGVFEKLRMQVKEDVDIRNGLRGDPPHYYKFEFSSHGSMFTASVVGNKIHGSVRFSYNVSRLIFVHDDKDNELLRAFVTLSNKRECVVRIKEEECELWQMRKMALEKLFFTDY
jgi:hypothetical protein